MRGVRAEGFPHFDFSTWIGGLVESVDRHPRKSDRYSVGLSGGEGGAVRVTVSDEALVRLGLRVGVELDRELATAIAADAEAALAWDLATAALARRGWSVGEMAMLLRRRGVSAAVVEAVSARLEGVGLLDDARFAESFVRARLGGQGTSVWRLRSDLGRKGVRRDVADVAIAVVMAEESVDDQSLARRAAERKWRSLVRLEHGVARRRLIAFLQRRGFSGAVVRSVVRELTMPAGGMVP